MNAILLALEVIQTVIQAAVVCLLLDLFPRSRREADKADERVRAEGARKRGKMEEGIENIMSFSVNGKTGFGDEDE